MEWRDVSKCPKCGKRTKVYDSRIVRNRLIRYRQCPDCWIRYKTIEIDYEVWAVFSNEKGVK